MANFFTSDEHFGHRRIIEYCSRPFKDLDDMANQMLASHNAVVGRPPLPRDSAARGGPRGVPVANPRPCARKMGRERTPDQRRGRCLGLQAGLRGRARRFFGPKLGRDRLRVLDLDPRRALSLVRHRGLGQIGLDRLDQVLFFIQKRNILRLELPQELVRGLQEAVRTPQTELRGLF